MILAAAALILTLLAAAIPERPSVLVTERRR